MTCSMTGFGQASRSVEGHTFQVEIRSVNHRYQETVIRLPSEWLRMEDALKKLVQHHIQRGRIDVFVTLERDMATSADITLNWPLADKYYAAATQVAERFDIPNGLTAHDMLSLPDIVMFLESEVVSTEWVKEQLIACTEEALQQLLEMRRQEGQHLQADISKRLRLLEQQRHLIADNVPRAQEEYRDMLRYRIEELLHDTAVDENRLLTEVAIMAERTNIDEELTRLESHVEQCDQLLQTEGPVGRKLDFLIQEMNREINTIGSKSIVANLVSIIVDMKAELEKIREQVQNIE